jgi:hypothetical protein
LTLQNIIEDCIGIIHELSRIMFPEFLRLIGNRICHMISVQQEIQYSEQLYKNQFALFLIIVLTGYKKMVNAKNRCFALSSVACFFDTGIVGTN